MSANIRIDQGSGAGAGTDGQARTNIWLSVLVELFDVGVGVPVSRLWTLDDKPPGSAATMLNPTTSVASFTPDVAGTYKITLARDGSVSGDNVKTLVVRVTRSNAGAVLTNIYPLPAFLEVAEHSDGIAGQGTAGRGYSPLFDSITATLSAETIRLDGVDTYNRTVIANADGAQTIAAGTTWIERDVLTQSGSGTIKMVTVAAPTTNRAGYRLIAKTRPGRVRQCLINPDGSQISFLTNEGPVYMTWRPDLGAGGRWVADKVYGSKQVYRPEDYAVLGPVGIGVAANDDAAWLALRADVETLDPAQLSLLDSQAIIELNGRYETTTGWVLASHWGYSDYVVKGISAGIGQAPLQMSQLRYVGPRAIKGFNTLLTFNRAARTIVRSTGSWVTAGVTVGMRIRVTTGSVYNKRIHQPVASITTTTNPNDTLVLSPPSENPVAGWDTSAILPLDEAAVACDWIQWLAGFEFRGTHNSRIENFGVWSRDNATNTGLLTCGIWISIKQDTRWNETSSNNLFQRLSATGMVNVQGTAAIAIGMSGGSPSIGSQCDTLRIRDCITLSCIDYGAIGTFTVSGNVLTVSAAHGLVQDEPVRVSADCTGAGAGLLPAELNFYTTYYVRYLTATTLELSLTQGGAAVVLATTGDGTRRILRPMQGAGIECLDGNNTKVIFCQDSKFSAAGRGIDFERASDGSAVHSCQIDTIGEVAVYMGAAGASIRDCQGERLSAAVFGPPSAAPVLVESCSFNCVTNDNRWDIFRGNLNLKRVHAHNARSDFSITSVDAGADTISFIASSAVEAPCVNQMIVLRNSSGSHRLPGNISDQVEYYLGDITRSGATYTARLYQAPGPLYLQGISSIGTGTHIMYSEVGWRTFDSSAQALVMEGCAFWGNGRYPRMTQSNSLSLWNPSNFLLTTIPTTLPRIHAKGNTSLIGGITFGVSDATPESALCFPSFYLDSTDMQLVQPGLVSVVQMDWRKISTGRQAVSRPAYFPRRCGLKGVYVEVAPDDNGLYGLGGPSITSATISVGYNGVGNLLPAFDVLAGSFADNVERRSGFQSTERGALLLGDFGDDKTFWPRDVGTTDAGWVTLTAPLQVDLTIGGAAMSALDQGRLVLYFLFEALPPVGFF